MIELFSRRGRTRRHYRDLVQQFGRLLPLADDPEDVTKRSDAVSTWSVGEQLEHIAKADAAVFDGIAELLADPSTGEGGPIRRARVLLLLGRIPRGKGRSPETLRSTSIDTVEVRDMLQQSRDAWIGFEPRLDEVHASRARTPHPALGTFNARQWVRFAQMHIKHHLRIIDDILAAQ